MNMKQLLITVLKISLVAGLIFWLLVSNKLNFSQLQIYITQPSIIIMLLGLWWGGYVLLGALRWYLLIRGQGLKINYWRAVNLTMIGFFFNTTMPGAVSGDIVKTYYLIREQHLQSKTTALMTVLLDRVMGLVSLFLIGGVAVMANVSFFFSNGIYMQLALFILIGVLAIIIGAGIIFYPFKDERDPFKRILKFQIPGFKLLIRIYDTVRAYQKHPFILLAALGLSIMIQVLALFFTLQLTYLLTGQQPDLGVFAAIFSIGIMTTALPLAPGGIGVGHIAFEKLFTLVNLNHGADVFNVMTLGLLALHLLGVIPYLLHRTELPPVNIMRRNAS